MRRVFSLVLGLFVLDCTARPSEVAVHEPVGPTLGRPVPAPVAETPPPRAPRPKRCNVPPPKPVAVDKLSEEGSCADHRGEERRIAPILQKRFHRTVQKSTLEVGFGCDPVTFEPTEVVVETGSGHGGSLALWWIRRSDSTADFEVTEFVHARAWEPYDHYDYQVADRFSAKVLRGRLSGSALDKALRTALPALTATFREIEPPRLPNSLHGFSASGSSHDFHAGMTVTDGGRILSRRYTGYQGSGGQEKYLGLELALEALSPVLETIKPIEAAISDEERAFFVKHVRSVAPTFYDQFVWWVRSRFLRLAGRLGATDLLPLLIQDLRHGLGEVDKLPEAERTDRSLHVLGESINGVVRLTGFDPRYGSDKKPRPALDVAKEIVEECSP